MAFISQGLLAELEEIQGFVSREAEAAGRTYERAIFEEEDIANIPEDTALYYGYGNAPPPRKKRTPGLTFIRRGRVEMKNPDADPTERARVRQAPDGENKSTVNGFASLIAEGDREVAFNHIHPPPVDRPLPSHAPYSYVPFARCLEDMHLDDENLAEKYQQVYKYDDDLFVDGVRQIVNLGTWESLALYEPLLSNVQACGYPKLRMVQRAVIPLILDNMDVIACTGTGSGKTLAYLIPVIQKCMEAKYNGQYVSQGATPYAVIVLPTRELTYQSYENALKFTEGTGVSVGCSYGEYCVIQNRKDLGCGCDLLFITPGRLKHFATEFYISLKLIRFLIFDEGDYLLKKDVFPDISAILTKDYMPENDNNVQTMFFSAAFNGNIVDLATQYLRRGPRALVSSSRFIPNQLQYLDFKKVLKDERFASLMKYLHQFVPDPENPDYEKLPFILVFVRCQGTCDQVGQMLQDRNVPSIFTRGCLRQDLRQQAFDDARNGKTKVLVTTDLYHRGLNINNLEYIVNYDMPDSYDDFIYRIGRAGRIQRGYSMSFVDPRYDHPLIVQIGSVFDAVQYSSSEELLQLRDEIKGALAEGLYDAMEEDEGFDIIFDHDPMAPPAANVTAQPPQNDAAQPSQNEVVRPPQNEASQPTQNEAAQPSQNEAAQNAVADGICHDLIDITKKNKKVAPDFLEDEDFEEC